MAALGQLAQAAGDPALRTTSVGEALARLAERGWPGPAAAADLRQDHRFLQQLALRLRLVRDRPEDVLAPTDLEPLARTLGTTTDALRDELDRRTSRVRRIYQATI